MRYIFLALLLTACSNSGGGSSEIVQDSLLMITHKSGNEPHGYLQVEPDGMWLFQNADACLHTQGNMETAKIGEIEQWVKDPALDRYITRSNCEDTDYIIDTANSRMCWGPEVPDAESAQALFSLFEDMAGKLKWDGMKRECDSTKLTAQPSGRTKQTDAPPPSMTPAAK